MMSWCLMSSDVSWHIRDKLWPMPKHGAIFTSTETRRLVRTDSPGRPPRLSHSSWTTWQLLKMMMSWCLVSSDVIWHIRDKLWPMPKHGSIKAVPAGIRTRSAPELCCDAFICEQVLFIYVFTAVPPRLSDPCNFITVGLLLGELEQTTLLFWSTACSVTPHGLIHTADRR